MMFVFCWRSLRSLSFKTVGPKEARLGFLGINVDPKNSERKTECHVFASRRTGKPAWCPPQDNQKDALAPTRALLLSTFAALLVDKKLYGHVVTTNIPAS